MIAVPIVERIRNSRTIMLYRTRRIGRIVTAQRSGE
jgi:hypothetical protein